jgi:hypothetical protein
MTGPDDFRAAANRAAHWIDGRLGADGAFIAARSSLLAHYKAPVALLAASRPAEAANALVHANREFLRGGSYRDGPVDGAPQKGATYRNGWLGWGAHQLGAFDVARVVLDHIERSLHPSWGGAPDNALTPAEQREFDVGSTCSAINALLAGGRTEAAVRAGSFLAALYAEQKDSVARLLLRRTPAGDYITPEAGPLSGPAETYAIDFRRTGQIYWYFGFSMRVFARLFLATGDSKWLAAGDIVVTLLQRCNPEYLETITNGKVAWGAADLYAATGDGRFRQLAVKVAGWMITSQDADGVWVRKPQYRGSSDQPLPVSLDTSLERLFYMYDIPRALAFGTARTLR